MNKYRYIHREIEPLVEKFSRQFPAMALTGPRQSGKSTLLRKTFSKSHRYITFDDPLIRQKAISDPRFFLDELKEPVIFDEVQYVPELLSYLKIRIDDDRGKMGRFILTGSQKFNLIKNLGDSLAGRIGLLTLLPFSHSELKLAASSKSKALNSVSLFIGTCLRGSFPEPNVRKKLDPHNWYGSYLQTYLERDVRTTFNIGSLREFEKFLQILAVRCGQVLNLSSLSNDLGVAVNTIKNWLSVLEASQIIYLLQPYYQNLGKRITKSPKLYFLDCGLVCYLAGISDKEHLLNGPMAGALFENYVIQETVKFYFNKGRTPNLFYVRTHNELEVDLIIEHDMALFPFEIKLTKTPKIEMANPIQRLKSIFPGKKMGVAKIVGLNESSFNLSGDVAAVSVDDYLKRDLK
jgi:predicted AAA+ superfamily ATPase